MIIEQAKWPAMRVASYRRVGPYGPGSGEAFGKICAWADGNGLFRDGGALVLGLYHDCPKTNKPEECRMDACVTLAPDANPPLTDGIVIQTLPAKLYASALCSIHGMDFQKAWEGFVEALCRRKAEFDWPCAGPAIEIYYGPCAEKHPMRKWIVDLLMPLQKKME